MSFKIYEPSKIVLNEIISDIERDLIDEFLFWSPMEHYFPGDGRFNDEGKNFDKLITLINEKKRNFFCVIWFTI